jgi:sugar lactone lactonase YvrE
MIPTIRKRLSWKSRLSRLTVLGLTLCATAAFAAVPPVVVDTQLTDPAGLNNPQSIVLAPNNMIYVADTGNNQILVFPPHAASATKVSTAPFTLVGPNAVAVDSSGDLFIGDSPATGTGRVLEALATNGVLNGTVNQVVRGGPLQDVTALAFNSATSTLYVGDDISSAIYTVTLPGNTAVKLALTGIPAGFIPAALALDSAGNLFVADFLTTLYEVPSGSLAAQTYVAPGFILNSPTGLAFDRKGDLYILTLGVPFGTTGGTPVELIVEIPGEDATSAFLVPLNNVGNGSSMATDTEGNLYVTDFSTGDIVALFYGSPFDLFNANVGATGNSIPFSYEFNAPLTVGGFKIVSAGDTSTEVVDEGGTCANGKYTDGENGGAISPSNPALCQESFAADPAFPGVRIGAVELKGTGANILDTAPVYSTGTAGASVVYPLTASTGASGINAPEGLVVSGLDKKLYIVNAAPGAPQILSANGPDGTTLTTVDTSALLLGIPFGITINGAGDLYFADFAFGVIDVIPAVAGQTPFSENPGNLLQHPLSVAFDVFGNLYIGDAGPAGSGADAATPGYIVEVPADGGAPFKLSTGGITTIFPLSLTTDPVTADVYIGDGGDTSETGAQVVKVAAANGAATVVTPAGVTQPVGLVFDPAEELYVLDQNADTITVVPHGGAPFSLPFDNTLFTTPVSLAITNGGQSLVESNVTASTSNSLVFLNGLASPLAFGSVADGQQGNLTATVNNIGNLPLTFETPYFTSNNSNTHFDVLGSSTCAGGVSLNPTVTCAINVQFTPTDITSPTERLTLNTNGYNNGDSVIDLSGTSVRSSTVTVTCSPNPLVPPLTTSCTAQVSGAGATPTGTVVFSVGGTTWETLTLNGSGSATATDGFVNAPVGTYTVSVDYSGDSTHSAATGTASVVVNAPGGKPTVTVTCSPNPLVPPLTTSCTAQVSGGATGTAVFTVAGYAWETLTLNGSGSATATNGFVDAPPGTYTVLVNYSGSSNLDPATGTAMVVVN